MKEEFIELLRSTKREGIENLLNFLENQILYSTSEYKISWKL